MNRLPDSWPWILLATLLALLLLGAATVDRSSWPVALVGDEATYLMQAESLAWDQDLLYMPWDYERFERIHQAVPEGLILQSGDGGERITFGKPIFYALYIAPFLRVSRDHGAYIANAFLLALAALTAARTLERRVGPLAPLLVILLVFASVTFIYTFWAHADLFLMSLVALAFALAFAAKDLESAWSVVPRWAMVGLLLAVVGFSRPMYAALFVPALAALPRPLPRKAALSLVAGGLALLLGAGALHHYLTGSWTAYGAQRRGFYTATGFPGIDFAASDWNRNLAEFGNHAVLNPGALVRQKKVDASLWAWNSLYFLVGGHVGVIPYFLPFLLCFKDRPRGLVGWSLLAAVVAASLAFFYLRPFNFHGGGGAVANRYFLPLYPALWFLARRPLRPASLALVGLASAVFMLPLWIRPLDFPLEAKGSYAYASPLANCCLPHETTLGHLKVSGREDMLHRGLWIRFLSRGIEPLARRDMLRLGAGESGRILVGSSRPLTSLEVDLVAPPAVQLEVDEAVAVERLEGRRWRVDLGRARAVHPMWWTWEPFFLYRLTFRANAERPLRLTLSAMPRQAVLPPVP